MHPGVQRQLGRAADALTVAGLLGFVVLGAVVAVACAGAWAGVCRLRRKVPQGGTGVWVKTCPVTGEEALVVVGSGGVEECTGGAMGCGGACVGKTTTVRSGFFDTPKLLKLQYKADSANLGC